MIGQVIGGRYELTEELGSDSVFDLYRGKSTTSGEEVFVRGIEGRTQRNEAFRNQVTQLIGRLKPIHHPGVEKLISAHQESNGYFIVSEYAPGSVLETRLKRLATLTVLAAVATAIDLCEGLVSLHSAHIVHGDISTRTVLSTSGEGAKLLLPGMWQAYGQDPELAVAMIKQMAPYLAPEVTDGGMPTPQSDIYAMGVLLWQMLVGRVPYHGDQPAVVAAKHRDEPYPSLEHVAATVPYALDKIIGKCMEKNPLQRYGSARELLGDLRAVQDALRFGRKITWPIHGPASVEAAASVAPELNAIDAKPQPAAATKKVPKSKPIKEESDGVPMWVAGVLYTVTFIFLLMVGGWVFFNAQKPKLLVVPNLVSMDVEQARKELEPTGLKLREARREVSERVPEGVIISTDPAPGDNIREGQRIEAVVSKGSKYVEVPDFRGRTIEEARQIAKTLNLVIDDADIERVRDRELDEGLIVSHAPEARKKVERYTRLKIKVSNGNRRSSSDRPSPTHTNRVQFKVPSDLDRDVLVRVDVTDDEGTKTVFEELMSPGTDVDERVRWQGDELIIRIFFDGELIKQQTAKPEDG